MGQRLSYLVKRRKAEIYQNPFYVRLKHTLSDFYNPSLRSLLIVFVLSLASWIFSSWRKSPLSTDDIQLIGRLQAIEIGIALIFVPFTVFVIGLSSRRTESGVTAAEVILKQTYLFPIAALVLGLLASFAFLKRPTYGRFLILLTLALGLFCIARLCRVLLDEHYLHKSSISLLQDKIRWTIGLAVEQRLGRNIFLSWLEDKKVEYTPFTSSSRARDNVRVSSIRNGTVTDIHLDRLVQFIDELEVEANAKGFSFEEAKAPSEVSGSTDQTPTRPLFRSLKQERNRYIAKLFGDPVGEDSNVLAFFPREFVPDPRKQENLSKIVQRAFVVGTADSFAERVERNLTNVKEEAILAIRDRRTSYLENLLAVYEQLAETFLQEMKKLMGGHSLEAARQEQQTISGGWNELRWISTQLREIQRRGCLSEDHDLARLTIRTPVRIAYKAITYRDHLLFEEFTLLSHRAYLMIQEVKDTSLRSSLVDRIWHQFRELGEYGIGWELDRDEQDPKELAALGSLASVLLYRCQGLLLVSLERRQFEDFQRFLTGSAQLLARTVQRYIGDNFESRRETQRAVLEKIQIERQRLFFSVGSFLLAKLGPADDPELRTRLDAVSGYLVMSLGELTTLYLTMHDPVWGMSIADMPGDGMGAAGDPYDKVDRYLSYMLLKLSQPITVEQLAVLQLPSASEFIARIEPNGIIRTILDQFIHDRQRWGALVPDAWLEKVPLLCGVFDRLIWTKKRDDENRLINTPIDSSYVTEFRKRFRSKFEDSSGVRRLFYEFGAYIDRSAAEIENKGQPRWGFNLLDPKAAYVPGDQRSYVNWPEEYANSLATSESEFAFHQILEQLPASATNDLDDLPRLLTEIEQELMNLKTVPQSLLVAIQSGFLMRAERLTGFLRGLP